MPLEPGVDGEAAGRGVHAGDVLDVVDVLGAELVPVVPAAGFEFLSHFSGSFITHCSTNGCSPGAPG